MVVMVLVVVLTPIAGISLLPGAGVDIVVAARGVLLCLSSSSKMMMFNMR